jgi:hypothetical protein
VTAASHPAFCTRSPAWPSGSTGGDCKAEGAQLSACVQPSRLAGGGGDGGESVAVGFVVVVLARDEPVTGAAAAPEESAHASAQQARRPTHADMYDIFTCRQTVSKACRKLLLPFLQYGFESGGRYEVRFAVK